MNQRNDEARTVDATSCCYRKQKGLLSSLGIIACLSYMLVPTVCAAQSIEKHVLLLYGFTEHSFFDSVESTKSALRSNAPWPIDFNVEYIEGQRLHEQSYEQAVVEDFRSAYSKQKIDLVMAYTYPALDFAIRHRDELFPGVPIVFQEVASTRVTGKKWPGVTGVVIDSDFVHGTVDLALRLHSTAKTIAIITNTSAFEKLWLEAVHKELARHQHLAVVDLVGLSPEKLFSRVNNLPSDAVVLFEEGPQEAQQPAIGPYEVVAFVGERRPTYSIWPVACLGHGCIGGVDWNNKEQTLLATNIARRVLYGERAEDIPIARTDLRVEVDWQQLQRWHIPDSSLPPGSLVINREPAFWERYHKYILAAAILLLAQSLLIVALLWQRARKRKAEAVLRESEKRFRVMADTTPSLVWMCDETGKIIYLNHRWAEFTGPDLKAGYGDGWQKYVHPADLKDLLPVFSQALKTPAPFSSEYRLRCRDGGYRWMFDVVAPRVNGDGSFAGLIGSAIDITDQKMAQDALANVSGRLIEAQEKERTRIARDLHDDICQRLAVLSVELEQANRNGAPPSTKRKLEEIRQHCSEIAGDVQALSHQLHSSKLDYLGTAAAIGSLCREFALQQKAEIEFKAECVPSDLPKEISLCLFRITQEALHNAIKYSGTREFRVKIEGTADEVELVVEDAGAGFDVEQAKRNRGLGLVSMQERVNLVHGRFRIESRPGAGTKITAAVPISQADSYPADENTAAAAARGIA